MTNVRLPIENASEILDKEWKTFKHDVQKRMNMNVLLPSGAEFAMHKRMAESATMSSFLSPSLWVRTHEDLNLVHQIYREISNNNANNPDVRVAEKESVLEIPLATEVSQRFRALLPAKASVLLYPPSYSDNVV
jgi:hypothetical protein